MIRVEQGDALEVLRSLPDRSAHALVTDPPAGISFMGKAWDGDKGGRTQWIAWLAEILREARRVLKPGAHALVWAIPRTSHWTATALEDAGYEVRDVVVHLFGTGFPKSLNLSGAWQGWGTALKPAAEHWILARVPLEGTVARNVLDHGTGAINIDGCRIGDEVESWPATRSPMMRRIAGEPKGDTEATGPRPPGRWPANVCFSEDAAAELVEASRYFYCPKASRSEKGHDNRHPTVKPLELMRWLVRLITPRGGLVLDPFAGSGSTGLACLAEGCFDALLIEQDGAYARTAIERAQRESPLFHDIPVGKP